MIFKDGFGLPMLSFLGTFIIVLFILGGFVLYQREIRAGVFPYLLGVLMIWYLAYQRVKFLKIQNAK